MMREDGGEAEQTIMAALLSPSSSVVEVEVEGVPVEHSRHNDSNNVATSTTDVRTSRRGKHSTTQTQTKTISSVFGGSIRSSGRRCFAFLLLGVLVGHVLVASWRTVSEISADTTASHQEWFTAQPAVGTSSSGTGVAITEEKQGNNNNIGNDNDNTIHNITIVNGILNITRDEANNAYENGNENENENGDNINHVHNDGNGRGADLKREANATRTERSSTITTPSPSTMTTNNNVATNVSIMSSISNTTTVTSTSTLQLAPAIPNNTTDHVKGEDDVHVHVDVILHEESSPMSMSSMDNTSSSSSSSSISILDNATFSSASRSASKDDNKTELVLIIDNHKNASSQQLNTDMIVPLLPWEQTSLDTRVCDPGRLVPGGAGANSSSHRSMIPKYCCIGSLSRGGFVKYDPRSCHNTADDSYRRIQDYATHVLQRNDTYLSLYPPHPHEHQPDAQSVTGNNTSSVNSSVNSSGSGSGSTQQQLQQKTKTVTVTVTKNPCDVCQIVDYLLDYNLTFTLVGDSMTAQSAGALECELHRRGYQVQNRDYHWKKASIGSCKNFRNCMNSKRRFTIQRPSPPSPIPMSLQSEQPEQQQQHQHAAQMYHYIAYRPNPSDNNTEIKQEIIDHIGSDIVIFDHGLHYTPGQATLFGQHMELYLEAYKDANLTLLAWRETSSQHTRNSGPVGGHYLGPSSSSKGEDKKSQCDPITDRQEGFRMPLMREAARRAGFQWTSLDDANFNNYTQMPIQTTPDNHHNHHNSHDIDNELVCLPFRQYTLPLDYLHPGECSHFCHTPYFWLPLWRSIRLALDRAMALKHGHMHSSE
jgi:hypothetical protein